MRRPLIAANWKMNTTSAEADALARSAADLGSLEGVEVVLCPPYVWLERVHRILEGSGVALGAQNVFWQGWGPYTGEVSPLQLRELCGYVIVGQSERRSLLGETDDMVAAKCRASVEAGLTTILAVEEAWAQHAAGEAEAVVHHQLAVALGSEWHGPLVVAYEPVWAIGTGLTPTASDVAEVHALIRDELRRLLGKAEQWGVRILYGGSVKPSNAKELLSVENVDGALVGGASLVAEDFLGIARAYSG